MAASDGVFYTWDCLGGMGVVIRCFDGWNSYTWGLCVIYWVIERRFGIVYMGCVDLIFPVTTLV